MSVCTQKMIGRSTLQVSYLGLGCWGLTGAYGRVDPKAARHLIHQAMDWGINFFDTADVYAQGENERLIGQAIKGQRQRIVLGTKFGYVGDERDKLYIDGRPVYVRKALENSLKRLDTDYIDLYYLHRLDPYTPVEDTVGAMARLQEEGKIRAIGLSEVSISTLKRASSVVQVEALQSEFSLFTQEPEKEILPFCEAQQISLIAFSPLGRGMLSDSIKNITLQETDYRHGLPRFQGEAFEKNKLLLSKILDIAATKGISLPQLALAWVLHRGNRVIPIPGTTNTAHLESNLQALNITFSSEELEVLAELGRQVKGARHNVENIRFFDHLPDDLP